MINQKEQILEVINTLPDDATWDDALYTLYFHAKLAESEKNLKDEKVITLQELKEYIDGLEEQYESDNI